MILIDKNGRVLQDFGACLIGIQNDYYGSFETAAYQDFALARY